MSAGDKMSLVTDVLAQHLDIKDEVAFDLQISGRDVIFQFLPDFKCRADILHFFQYRVPPICVAVLGIEFPCLLHRL